MLEEYDLSTLSLPGLEFEWNQITESISKSAPGRLWAESNDFRVGVALKKEGLEAEHPVILVPGIVSTVSMLHIIHQACMGIRLILITT